MFRLFSTFKIIFHQSILWFIFFSIFGIRLIIEISQSLSFSIVWYNTKNHLTIHFLNNAYQEIINQLTNSFTSSSIKQQKLINNIISPFVIHQMKLFCNVFLVFKKATPSQLSSRFPKKQFDLFVFPSF
jgi:hypothetical protein